MLTHKGIMQNQKSRYDIIASYYSRHLEEVRGYVGSRLQYSEATDDIVQTIFERLLTMDKMITEVTLPCLVYTVARNLLCDYWRHHHMVEEFEHKLRQRQMVDEDMRMRNEVETVYSVHEIEEFLERGIARMADKEQRLYRLHIYGGKKVSEISSELGLSYKTVENRLGMARKEVRGYLRRLLI